MFSVTDWPSRQTSIGTALPISDSATTRGKARLSFTGRLSKLRITSCALTPAWSAGPPGVVPAIRGFDVGYERSDHQVKLLFMGPVTRSAIDTGDLLVSLQDHDGNDAISGSVRLTDLRGLGRHLDVTRTECPRDCRLRIPHLISSEAFVLTGFAFRLAARGTDRNLLQVKVRQAAHNGYIDVAFVDRAGTAPYFAQVTYAVIPRSLLGPYLVQARGPGPARGEAVEQLPERCRDLAGNALLNIAAEAVADDVGCTEAGRIFSRLGDLLGQGHRPPMSGALPLSGLDG